MDVFFEQIIEKRRSAKDYLLLALIWLVSAALAAFLIALFYALVGPIVIFVAFFIFYGAYKLSMNFFVEYEYIITNGTLDIDKIIAKSSRKRMASIELSQVQSLEKYNAAARPKSGYERIVIACNECGAYAMVTLKEGKGKQYIVFSPNEKLQGAIVKSLPKFIANSAFK